MRCCLPDILSVEHRSLNQTGNAALNVRLALMLGLLLAYYACLKHAVLQMFGSEEAEIPIHMALWRSPAPDPRLVLATTS
jgi:hypothetical protein